MSSERCHEFETELEKVLIRKQAWEYEGMKYDERGSMTYKGEAFASSCKKSRDGVHEKWDHILIRKSNVEVMGACKVEWSKPQV